MMASPVVVATALVTILALVFYFVTLLNVARMRYKHGVKAPAVTGPLEFECAMRVQMNTLEHLPILLPLLWLTVFYFSPFPAIAPILGLIWIIGRILFMAGYMKAPEKRGLGFRICALSQIALLLTALTGVVIAFTVTATV